MGTLDKNNNRSFHHRIGERGGHYFDSRHFLGIDPFDHTIFRDNHLPEKIKVQKRRKNS